MNTQRIDENTMGGGDAIPEVSAPVRLEGQSNSEVLFTWLTVKGYLWMLEAPHDQTLEGIVGARTSLRLAFKLMEWRRERRRRKSEEDAQPVPAAPDEGERREEAFARLKKLIEIHFFGKE